MSRIGKQPIEIPQGVNVRIDGRTISVQGPKGELSLTVSPYVDVQEQEGRLVVSMRQGKYPKTAKALWGTTRTLVANMIHGVREGFEKKLEFEGVGYRAAADEQGITLNMGFSHPVHIKNPEGVAFSVEKNVITVSGINKEAVGEYAARIRKVKKVEPYKGKGIRYQGEQVRRKLGKKAAGAA